MSYDCNFRVNSIEVNHEKPFDDNRNDRGSSKSPQKELRLQLKEAFGASFPLINDEASNVLSSNYLQIDYSICS